MDNESKEELFSVKLNNDGGGHILRFAKLAKLFLGIGIVITLAVLTRNIMALLGKRGEYKDDFLNIFFTLYPFISTVVLIAFILQMIFYQKLASSLSAAIRSTDEKSFNSSFENLVKGIWYANVVALFSLLFTGVELYIMIKYGA